MASSFYDVDPADWIPLARAKENRDRVRRFLHALAIAVDRRNGLLKVRAVPSTTQKPVRFRADGEYSPTETARPMVVPLGRFDRQVAFLQSNLRNLLAFYRIGPRRTRLAEFLERSSAPDDEYISLRPDPAQGTSDTRDTERAVFIQGRFGPAFKRTPPWYYGFVRETRFRLQYRCSSSVIVKIEFGNNKTGKTAIHQQLTPSAFGEDKFWTYEIAKRIPWEMALSVAIDDENISDILTLLHFLADSAEYGRSPDIRGCAMLMDVDTGVWGNFKTTDAFSHIKISILGGGSLIVKGIGIRLNDEEIFDSDTAQTRYSNYRLTSENPIILDKEILLNRLKQVGIHDISKVDGIVSAAARHIGESWNPSWPGNWTYTPIPWLEFWDSTARNWCNEFASVIINRTMGLDENDDGRSLLDETVNAGTSGMAPWFKCFHPTRWIGTTTGTYRYRGGSFDLIRTPYAELGNAVQSGFYMTVDDQDHATFFVGWGSDISYQDDEGRKRFFFKYSNFDDDQPNGLLTIGGNQGDVVNAEPRTITPQRVDDSEANIFWDNQNINLSDGFGTTRVRLRKKL